MKIILSGPDGTGKSTIVRGLQRSIGRTGKVQVSWRRFGFVFARALNVVGKSMGLSYYEKTPFGSIGYHRYRGTFARTYIAVSYLDCVLVIIPKWWLHDWLNQSKTQIVDRYLIDIVADLILSTANARFVLWLFDSILKRHIQQGNCILLACDHQTVIERRPDIAHDKSYVRKVQIYTMLRRIYRIPEIATDRAPPEACITRILSKCAS